MKRWLVVLLILGGFAAGEALAQQGLEPAPEGVTGREIAERVEDIFRGQTSYLEATMTITSPRLPTNHSRSPSAQGESQIPCRGQSWTGPEGSLSLVCCHKNLPVSSSKHSRQPLSSVSGKRLT